MTITSEDDKRNASWSSSSNGFGRKMLSKMGWKGDGHGLGKNQTGSSVPLRALRREDGMGLGAESDVTGERGWSESSANYKLILERLHQVHYGEGANAEQDSSTKDKKKKKKKKKRQKVDEGSDAESNSNGLTLASNRISVGHARKMRDSKDLGSKSVEDMAAVFGMKVNDFAASAIADRREKDEIQPLPSVPLANEDQLSDSGKKRQRKRKREGDRNLNAETASSLEEDHVERDGSSKKEKKRKKKKKKKKKCTKEGRDGAEICT